MRVTTVYYSVVLLSVFFFLGSGVFLVLLAFEQASSTLVPPPNPTQPFVSLITHYTSYIIHHVVGELGASDAASKQTSDTLHFHPKFSWTEERGEEMRGEEKEFVIDHKKDKRKERKKKEESRSCKRRSDV